MSYTQSCLAQVWNPETAFRNTLLFTNQLSLRPLHAYSVLHIGKVLCEFNTEESSAEEEMTGVWKDRDEWRGRSAWKGQTPPKQGCTAKSVLLWAHSSTSLFHVTDIPRSHFYILSAFQVLACYKCSNYNSIENYQLIG